MATEPTWNKVQAALVSQLKNIRRSSDSTKYWYDVRSVFETPQGIAQVYRSRLPALIVLPEPSISNQAHVGGNAKTAVPAASPSPGCSVAQPLPSQLSGCALVRPPHPRRQTPSCRAGCWCSPVRTATRSQCPAP